MIDARMLKPANNAFDKELDNSSKKTPEINNTNNITITHEPKKRT